MNEMPRLCLPPLPAVRSSALNLPAGSCDCHFHVFDPGAELVSPRSYTPSPAPLSGWTALADAFGIARGVAVQPSVYGLDNSVLLSALAAMPQCLRGIAVVGPETSRNELHRLHAAGVRGMRINLRNKAVVGFETVERLAPVLGELGWHVVYQVGPDQLTETVDLARRSGLAGIIDHLGFVDLTRPDDASETLMRALDAPQLFVKVSGSYRLPDSADAGGFLDLVARLGAAFPEKLLWGSDWPHTEMYETVPEDEGLVALALRALPAAAHRAVFVDTPNALYWTR
jgi:2-pyrone-4,6-dicarboxylate lactonase